MDYETELQRIVSEVEKGSNMYALVTNSQFVSDPEWFTSLMRNTDHPDEYANMLDSDPPSNEWEYLTGHVAFFAMCADIRERLS